MFSYIPTHVHDRIQASYSCLAHDKCCLHFSYILNLMILYQKLQEAEKNSVLHPRICMYIFASSLKVLWVFCSLQNQSEESMVLWERPQKGIYILQSLGIHSHELIVNQCRVVTEIDYRVREMYIPRLILTLPGVWLQTSYLHFVSQFLHLY